MSDWEMKLITAEARRLLTLAAEDAGLRAELRALAEEVLAATGPPRAGLDAGMEPLPSEDVPTSPSGAGSSPDPTTPEVARADPVPAPEPLRELTLGRSPTARSETRPAAIVGASGSSDDDLPEIEARCRRKTEAARWAAERQRRAREGTDFPVEETPTDREVAEWADRLSDRCHGMDAPDVSQPPDVSRLDDVGGCFEAVAEALSLARGALDDRRGHPKALERGLSLVAEAQSALRAAIQLLQAPDDPDQLRVFEWLKATAAWHRVFIKRFMRADDPADPDPLARPPRPHRTGAIPTRPGRQADPGPRRRSSVSEPSWVPSGRARMPATGLASGHRGRGRDGRRRGFRPATGRSGTSCCPCSTSSPSGTTCRMGSGSSCGRSTGSWRPGRVRRRRRPPTSRPPRSRRRPTARRQGRRADRREPPARGPGVPEDGPWG